MIYIEENTKKKTNFDTPYSRFGAEDRPEDAKNGSSSVEDAYGAEDGNRIGRGATGADDGADDA